MTNVWTTAKGGRYHRAPNCEALAEGQSKALSEGRWTYPPRSLPLSRVAPSLTPCSVCWAEESARDPWLFVDHAVERQGDSQYESEFVRRVLKRSGLVDPDHVRAQHWAAGRSGQRYRLDFAVVRAGKPNIAIEVDGFEKRPGEDESATSRQDRTSARGNDLSNAGWRVLHFTNRQVMIDWGDCRRVLEEALLSDELPEPAGSPNVRPSQASVAASQAGPVSQSMASPDRGSAPPPTATAPSAHRNRGAVAWIGAGLAAVAIVGAAAAGIAFAGGGGSASPSGSSCPGEYPVKGNQSESGERIYHEPGWRYYSATWPEECFADAGAARDAGYRASEVR